MTAAAASAPRRFAALRVADCRTYLIGGALAMMADNIEHVITYWVLWQRYHSPVLAGFEVFSHWLPFLLLSIPFGALADRFDCRRVIQAGQLLFAAVSIAWGVLFATNTLTVQAACVLLVLHGTAGALWGPAEQLMLHDFVGPDELPSAVRLNSTFRSLGILFGPVVGGLLLVGLGPEAGIFVNALFYVPLILFLLRTRATGHTRDVVGDTVRFGFRELGRIARFVVGDRTLLSMMALAGLGSFFVGASLQAVMPAFAGRLGAGEGDAAYSMLLFATGAGGVLGGLLLEATGWPRPTIRAAVVSTLVYGAGILGFAMTASFALALVLLFLAGAANLASMSISQTVVQLIAPPAERGRVLGFYGVAANGLRLGSGVTVGLFGAVVGVGAALTWSAAALCVGTVITGAVAAIGYRSAAGPEGRTARA
ncbi:MAG TPA: MFS transporter [Amnibacterium sp.]|uniref:MFS transporter n=1 Tax=Amnibacterium sp. TaxID=1872496 RepID=UPI002F95DE24